MSLTIAQRLMRLLAPVCERQRMDFRETLARTTAHAENLQRDLQVIQPKPGLETR